VLVAFQWQQFYHLEAATRTETPKWPRRITYRLTDRILMRPQQTPLSPGLLLTPPCAVGAAA
jgi:hypothetical protein